MAAAARSNVAICSTSPSMAKPPSCAAKSSLAVRSPASRSGGALRRFPAPTTALRSPPKRTRTGSIASFSPAPPPRTAPTHTGSAIPGIFIEPPSLENVSSSTEGGHP